MSTGSVVLMTIGNLHSERKKQKLFLGHHRNIPKGFLEDEISRKFDLLCAFLVDLFYDNYHIDIGEIQVGTYDLDVSYIICTTESINTY